MRVITTKTEDEIFNEFFGPIQEAARKPYMLDLDPRKSWCELSELRLSSLICEFKPCGINRHLKMIAIIERMEKIFHNEKPQAEIFLSEPDKIAFHQQQQDLLMGGRPERASFPPKYTCRPSLDMIEEKLNKWFGLKVCEDNESYPTSFSNVSDFKLPEFVMTEVHEKKENEQSSPLVKQVPNRKRKAD